MMINSETELERNVRCILHSSLCTKLNSVDGHLLVSRIRTCTVRIYADGTDSPSHHQASATSRGEDDTKGLHGRSVCWMGLIMTRPYFKLLALKPGPEEFRRCKVPRRWNHVPGFQVWH